jgi:hypothetical protein
MLITVLLLLIVQISDAQYSLMTKGQLCPFDSAVAVRLDVYRLETRKLNLGDTIINNLKQQLALNTKTIQELNTQIYLRDEMLLIKDKQIADKDRTIELLSTNFYIKPKDTWFKRNERTIYFIGGLITGGGIIYLVK